MKSHKPAFNRPNAFSQVRVKRVWRKPKGMHSKIRKRRKWSSKMPNVGYGNASSFRGLHPSGLKEVLVTRINDLKNVNPKNEAIRIYGRLSRKNKEIIIKEALKLKIKVFNARKPEEYLKRIGEERKEKQEEAKKREEQRAKTRENIQKKIKEKEKKEKEEAKKKEGEKEEGKKEEVKKEEKPAPKTELVPRSKRARKESEK